MYKFYPNRNFYILLSIVILFAVFATPAMAQDGLTTTNPGSDNGGGMPAYQFVLMFLLVVLAFGYAAFERITDRKVHLEALDLLYKSVPPFIRQPAYDFAIGTSEGVINELEELARTTEWTDLDDRAAAEGRRILNEAKARWQQLQAGGTSDPLDPFPPLG